MIWVTAIFGSYLFLISFSMFTDMRWPLDLNLPELESVGAISKVTDSDFYLYMSLWTVTSVLGTLLQCCTLWRFKKTGKVLRWPVANEAIQTYKYGKTAEEHKRDQEVKELDAEIERM